MALTIYGSPRSRTMRTLWTAAERGLEYEHVPLTWDDPALKAPDFLQLNPAGTIPTIMDHDFALAESMAINLYLAKKYGSQGSPPLYPENSEEEAEVWRWSFWAQGHLEPWLQRDAKLDAVRTAARDAVEAAVQAALTTLDRVLSERVWLVADHFTVGDLNVAGVLSPSRLNRSKLDLHRHASAWLARCYDRPAARATRAMFSS
jgi:glutathione S-transferase